MSSLQHRLAAILAADAAGYLRLMVIDDRATVVALDAARARATTFLRIAAGLEDPSAADALR